jgi:hypothetical protein
MKRYDPAGEMYVPIKPPPPLLNMPVEEEGYHYEKGKFYSGWSTFLGGRKTYINLKKSLTELVGLHGVVVVENVNESSALYKWRWYRSRVFVTLYYEKSRGRTTITFTYGDNCYLCG